MASLLPPTPLSCLSAPTPFSVHSAGKMYWTDYLEDAIFRADLSGENIETVVDTQLAVPGMIELLS